MLVPGDGGNQLSVHPLGGGFDPKKVFAHVVINTDDVHAFLTEITGGFRTDQPCRTCNHRNAQTPSRALETCAVAGPLQINQKCCGVRSSCWPRDAGSNQRHCAHWRKLTEPSGNDDGAPVERYSGKIPFKITNRRKHPSQEKHNDAKKYPE